jgi:uncharacterized protein (TIGR02391 family)
MPRSRKPEPVEIESRVFRTVEEIDHGVQKLTRRIADVDQFNAEAAVTEDTGATDVLESSIRETIRDVFGGNSPEFDEHKYLRIWSGPMSMGMPEQVVVEGTERGKVQTKRILDGLVARLAEKRADLTAGSVAQPRSYFDRLNLHPRIAGVANELYMDGHPWEAVFAAAKALVNFVKERSSRDDLDGAALMRTVFTKNDPILAFSDLSGQTELDEQEGMMHLFEGAVLAIRNPGGHAFPEGPDQRALEYISFLSLLAYRVQEAKKKRAL